MKEIGKKIKKLRNDAGYTQDELGKELIVTRQAVSSWERNRTEPDLDAITKICEIFSVPLSYFSDENNESVESDLSKVSTYESKITRFILAFSPILLFILLLPFMLKDVPYHTDLMGNIDRSGSRLFLFGAILFSSILLFYIYSNLNEKRIFFSVIIVASICNTALFLLASVVEMENFFRGFIDYIAESYGNQITVIMFAIMIIFFMIADIIPQNSVLGIRNSVTLRSKEAWNYVHTRAKSGILCCSMANLYIFLLPNVNNLIKMLLAFITVVIAIVVVTIISQKYNKEIEQ